MRSRRTPEIILRSGELARACANLVRRDARCWIVVPRQPRSAEHASFQDRAVADGSPDAEPQTPGFGGSRAEAKRQRADHGAASEEHRAAVEFAIFAAFQAVENLASRHADSHVE